MSDGKNGRDGTYEAPGGRNVRRHLKRMNLGDITIIVPTLKSRKEQFSRLLWGLCAKETPPPFRICAVIDEDDERVFPDFVQLERVPAGAVAVKAMEAGIVAAVTPLVLYLNDDVEVESAEFVGEALRVMNLLTSEDSGRPQVVVLNENRDSRRMATFALMDRGFYLRHVFPAPYRKFYVDFEIHMRAKALGVYAFAEKAVVQHVSPAYEGKAADDAADKAIYLKRMRAAGIFGNERLADRHLFIGIPVYGAMDSHFVQCLLRLVADPPCKISIRCNVGDSLVSRSRNTLTAQFLASDCTDLLFLDSDLIFAPHHVARMASHDEPVVGGLYPKKQQGPLSWVINAQDGAEPRADGLQNVRYVGTGFLRVNRSVFERMIEAFGADISYTPDHGEPRTEYDFWSVGSYEYRRERPGFRRYLSEDWFFCQRWLDLGGSVFADTRTVLKHSGQAIYPLLTQESEVLGQTPLPAGPSCPAEGGAMATAAGLLAATTT